jgi:hypothetical protein
LSPIGTLFQFAYRLRRHLWAGRPLSRWLGWLILLAGLAAAVYFRPNFWLAAPLGFLWLAYLALLNWTQRRGYIHFKTLSADQTLFEGPPPAVLRAEEMVPTRASGWFTVEGKVQYYVDVEAAFETVETREHIILGRIQPSRFLLMGSWPFWELGWWYIFFQPAMIQEMSIGHIHFGPQPRLALRAVYAPNGERAETIYLAFDNATTLRRVWNDLILDAPAGLASPSLAQGLEGD